MFFSRIVQAPGPIRGCHVCEVGPGPGGITRAILRSGVERLVVIEKDHRFLPGLQVGKITKPQPDILSR